MAIHYTYNKYSFRPVQAIEFDEESYKKLFTFFNKKSENTSEIFSLEWKGHHIKNVNSERIPFAEKMKDSDWLFISIIRYSAMALLITFIYFIAFSIKIPDLLFSILGIYTLLSLFIMGQFGTAVSRFRYKKNSWKYAHDLRYIISNTKDYSEFQEVYARYIQNDNFSYPSYGY